MYAPYAGVFADAEGADACGWDGDAAPENPGVLVVV